jgi:hypothetical protein
MSDDKRGINGSLLNAIEERPQVLMDMRLPRLKRQGFIHQRPERNLIDKVAIDTWDGNSSALADC